MGTVGDLLYNSLDGAWGHGDLIVKAQVALSSGTTREVSGMTRRFDLDPYGPPFP